jgi:hypothetical protein
MYLLLLFLKDGFKLLASTCCVTIELELLLFSGWVLMSCLRSSSIFLCMLGGRPSRTFIPVAESFFVLILFDQKDKH